MHATIYASRSKLPTELELSAGCKQIMLVEKIVSHPPRTAPQTAPPVGWERAAPSDSFMVVRICASLIETRPVTMCTVKLFQANKLE